MVEKISKVTCLAGFQSGLRILHSHCRTASEELQVTSVQLQESLRIKDFTN